MTKHQARKPKGQQRQANPDAIGGQDVLLIVDQGAELVRPRNPLEAFDARVTAMRTVPVGTKRTCGLPGCFEHWTETGGRGRQRMYCGGAHREQMSQRRLVLVREQQRGWPAGRVGQ